LTTRVVGQYHKNTTIVNTHSTAAAAPVAAAVAAAAAVEAAGSNNKVPHLSLPRAQPIIYEVQEPTEKG